MIVDFRVRPPFGGYLKSNIYGERQRTIRMVQDQGYAPSRSLVEADWGSFVREASEAKIDKCVVPGRFTTPSYGQISNQDQAAVARESGGLCVSFAAVDVDAPDAVDQLSEAIEDMGLAGLTLDPGFLSPPRYPDDRIFEALYKRCSELRRPVTITSSGHAGPDIGYADPTRIDRVAAAFPDLPIVVVHAGWPWLPQIFGVAFRRPNVFLSPDMYMINMPGAHMFVEAANGVLSDRVFFGSSYPFIPMHEALAYYSALPFKSSVLPMVLGGNAARLLNLA